MEKDKRGDTTYKGYNLDAVFRNGAKAYSLLALRGQLSRIPEPTGWIETQRFDSRYPTRKSVKEKDWLVVPEIVQVEGRLQAINYNRKKGRADYDTPLYMKLEWSNSLDYDHIDHDTSDTMGVLWGMVEGLKMLEESGYKPGHCEMLPQAVAPPEPKAPNFTGTYLWAITKAYIIFNIWKLIKGILN